MSKGLASIIVFIAMVAAALAQTGTVKEIVIEGNENVSREAILAAMRTKPGEAYNQGVLDQDKVAIEEMGFFQAVDVRAETLESNQWKVVVHVSEWPIIKEIRIVGNDAVSTEAISEAIPYETGAVFNSRLIAPTRQAIIDLYNQKGFFAEPSYIGPLEGTPEVLNIELIEQVVNSVTILGNTRTKDRVMKRLIKVRPGDPLSRDAIGADLRRIRNTDWFESYSLHDPEVVSPGLVDLTYEVKEGRTGTVGVGLQVDPRNSFAGFLRLSDSNFQGSGQTIGVSYLQSTSGDGPSVDLSYLNPFIDNKDTSMRFSVFSRLNFRFAGTTFGGDDTPTEDNRYTERRTGITLGFARPVKTDLVVSIAGKFEGVKTNDLDESDASGVIQQDGTVSVLSLGASYNKRDTDIDPAYGYWARAEIGPGFSNITKVGGLGSNDDILGANTFFRTSLEYRHYYSPQPRREPTKLDDPRRVIAFRARYGIINGTTPFFEQFFVGGTDTLRGYQEDRFWGKQQLLTTLEYRHPLQNAFNIIGFVDYGGAWGGAGSVNDFTQSDSFDMHLGYGIGAAFQTPLGSIRLDYGINEDGGGRVHFLIGRSF